MQHQVIIITLNIDVMEEIANVQIKYILTFCSQTCHGLAFNAIFVVIERYVYYNSNNKEHTNTRNSN